MNEKVLRVHTVEKTFGRVKAVDGLSFDVARGEIFALLGPNGAGKTTTIRMLVGIIRPDAGTVEFRLSATASAPAPPQPREIGYLPEDRGLYKEIPILRTLTYFGVLRGMDRGGASHAASSWLERLGLLTRAGDKLDALSKGNQQKVQFIAAVLHRPAFAILDEPFSGLDPINQEAFLDLLSELRAAGTTILLSAHQMQLVERIADRILVVNRGREVLAGSLGEIRERAGRGNRIYFRVEGDPDTTALAAHEDVLSTVRTENGEIALTVREGRALGGVLAAVGAHMRVLAVRSEAVSLHDLYVQAVGADARMAKEEE
jgi:ABC-2 type transport system ATP-binding protein